MLAGLARDLVALGGGASDIVVAKVRLGRYEGCMGRRVSVAESISRREAGRREAIVKLLLTQCWGPTSRCWNNLLVSQGISKIGPWSGGSRRLPLQTLLYLSPSASRSPASAEPLHPICSVMSSHTITTFRYDSGSKVFTKKTAERILELHEILIKITHSGICYTDVHAKDKGCGLGHEGVGYVTKIGDAVSGVRVGDRVGWG